MTIDGFLGLFLSWIIIILIVIGAIKLIEYIGYFIIGIVRALYNFSKNTFNGWEEDTKIVFCAFIIILICFLANILVRYIR